MNLNWTTVNQSLFTSQNAGQHLRTRALSSQGSIHKRREVEMDKGCLDAFVWNVLSVGGQSNSCQFLGRRLDYGIKACALS